MQVEFGLIEPEDLTGPDKLQLQNALDTDFTGTTLKDLLRDISYGHFHLWKLYAPETTGVLVTQFNQYPGGKELFLYLMGGKGLVPHTPLIMETFKCFAKDTGCGWLRSLSIPPVARFLKGHTELRTRYECMILEVD